MSLKRSTHPEKTGRSAQGAGGAYVDFWAGDWWLLRFTAAATLIRIIVGTGP